MPRTSMLPRDICTITLNVTDDDAGVGTATDQHEVVDAAGAIAAVDRKSEFRLH